MDHNLHKWKFNQNSKIKIQNRARNVEVQFRKGKAQKGVIL